MAKGKGTAAERAAEESKDFKAYASKKATDLQARFADWLVEKCGLEFSTKKEEAAFREGVRLGVALRIPFQASPENQAVRTEKAAIPAATPEPTKKAKAKGKAPVTAEANGHSEESAEAVAAAKPVKQAKARKVATSKAAPF